MTRVGVTDRPRFTRTGGDGLTRGFGVDPHTTLRAGSTCQNRGRILMGSSRQRREEVRFGMCQKSLAFPSDRGGTNATFLPLGGKYALASNYLRVP